MATPRILKTKWYLFRLTDSTLLLSKGVFSTESEARRVSHEDGVATIRGETLIKRMSRTEVKIA